MTPGFVGARQQQGVNAPAAIEARAWVLRVFRRLRNLAANRWGSLALTANLQRSGNASAVIEACVASTRALRRKGLQAEVSPQIVLDNQTFAG